MLNLYAIYRLEMLKFVPPKLLKWSASVLTPTHLRPISHFALSEILLTFAGSLQNAGSAPGRHRFISSIFINYG